MTRVDFITNVAPHYREHLWLMLAKDGGLNVRFLFGENPGSSIRTIRFAAEAWEAHSEKLVRLRNRYLRGVLIWQGGVIQNAFATHANICVLLGDMYVISTWIAALILRLRGRKVVFWGHGLYGNEKLFRRFFRVAFLRLASINLVYGERAKRLLMQSGFSADKVRVIYNSLDHETHVKLRDKVLDENHYEGLDVFNCPDLPVLLYVGRLTKQKKLEQLISVVENLNRHRARFNLALVGDGPARKELEEAAKPIQSYVCFLGPCYDEERLARLIANADLCVAPGEVGLSAVHCLSFGTPVCTHNNMSEQMPEAEAVIHNETGVLFDPVGDGLREGIESWFSSNIDRDLVRRSCYEIVDEKFNPSKQRRIFLDVFDVLVSS